MSRIVAISPQLGSAVFSCGGTLHRHASQDHEVVLVTVFTKGDGELMELRRAEDEIAVTRLGLAGPIHLGLDEPPADDAPRVARAVLAIALEQLEADLVLAPGAVGGSGAAEIVDGVLAELGVPRLRWMDQPGSQRPDAKFPEGERVAVPLREEDLQAKLDACAVYVTQLDEQFGGEDAMRAQLTSEAEFFVR